MSKKNKPLSKLEQIRLAAAAQSNRNIAQANINESRVRVSEIKLNPFQPRKYFDEQKLNDLANSIKENGLIQAITVANINDELILIAGERRLRAHEIAGLEYIDVNILYNITDDKLRELSLIENLQREDLTLIEEADAYKSLNEKYNKTYRDIAEFSGRSKTSIAEIINLSNFSEDCKELIQENKLKNTTILNSILKFPQNEHYDLIERLANSDLTLKELKEMLENNSKKASELVEDKIQEVKEKKYPYELPLIDGVNIQSKKNKLKIEIDMNIFDLGNSKNIEDYIKKIISNNK